MIRIEQLCSHIIHLVHAPIHVYDAMGVQINVYVDHGEQQDVIERDEDLRQLLLDKRKAEYPVLYLEAEQIIYGIVSNNRETYLLGPCCLKHVEKEAAAYLVKAHKMDSLKPYRVSYTTLNTFCEMVMMLFESLTGQTVTRDELLQKCFCDEKLVHAMKGKVHEVFDHLQENSVVHNPYGQEAREQEAIKKGDLEALKKSFQEIYVGEIGTLSHDPLRHEKNLAIVLITLASRSAISGGLLPEIAFSMSDAFIQHVEELKDIAKVRAFGRQAEIEYCKAVRNLSFGLKQNPLITRCKALILQRLHSKLAVWELAEELEITPGYLSHLFLKEEGVKLTEYIAGEKIKFAKEQLICTENSLDTIAYSLGFVSQSHFGQTFKKATGMTPKQYRESYKEN